MKFQKLRGKIIEKYGTAGKFAEAMGYSKQVISLRMTGKREWTYGDIVKASQLLDLTRDELAACFFPEEEE